MKTETGRVKWFSSAKGYGFIETPASETDVFVHFSAIDMKGYKSLRPDVFVVFELRHGDRGPSAHGVAQVSYGFDRNTLAHVEGPPHGADAR